MSITNTTHPLPVDPIHIEAMAAATDFYTKAWERDDFAFSPRVEDAMSRHTKLLEKFRDRLIHTSQTLEAKISPDVFGTLIALSAEGDDPDLKAQALEELASISDLLAQQKSFIGEELDALAALPELSELDDIQRLSKQVEEKAALITTAEQTSAQLAIELEGVDKAIATLKDSNLEAKSGALVPPTEQLTKVFGSAAKAQPIIAGVQLALKTLEQALGVTASGMTFKSLYLQASQLRERAAEQKAEARALTTQSATLQSQIGVLEKLPQLQQQLVQWKEAGKQLSAGVMQYQKALGEVKVERISDLSGVQGLCKEILAFERMLIIKISA